MSACSTDIVGRIATYTTFNAWKATTNAALEAPAVTPVQLDALKKEIFDTTNCLNEKIRGLSTLSTADANMQLTTESLNQKIKAEKANIDVAKERLQRITEPRTSFYASWFPIERPLKPISSHILLGLSTVMCFVAIAYLLQTMGLYILLRYVASLDKSSINMPTILTALFWIALIVGAGFAIHFLYK